MSQDLKSLARLGIPETMVDFFSFTDEILYNKAEISKASTLISDVQRELNHEAYLLVDAHPNSSEK
jgi:hypothetical protein